MIMMSRYTTNELFQEEILMSNYFYLEQKNKELLDRISEINSRLTVETDPVEYRKLLKSFFFTQKDLVSNLTEMGYINFSIRILHDK